MAGISDSNGIGNVPQVRPPARHPLDHRFLQILNGVATYLAMSQVKWVLVFVFLCGFLYVLYANSIINSEVAQNLNVRNSQTTQQSENNPTPAVTHDTKRCLTFDEDIDHAIASAKQTFVVMPPKAAGSTLKNFAYWCSREAQAESVYVGDPDQFLFRSFEPPELIASHLIADTNLIRLVQQTTSDTLIIFVYRRETDRLLSALKQVLQTHVCLAGGSGTGVNVRRVTNETSTTCVFEESALVNDVLKRKHGEMAMTIFRLLSCATYKAIEENAPNLLFVNYKQAARLQRALQKKHCPDLLEESLKALNVGATKPVHVYVRLNSTSWAANSPSWKGEKEVPLEKWIKAKRNLMEWSLNLKKDVTCQAETKRLEAALFNCPDELIQLGPSYL